jgi:hypothetical protein
LQELPIRPSLKEHSRTLGQVGLLLSGMRAWVSDIPRDTHVGVNASLGSAETPAARVSSFVAETFPGASLPPEGFKARFPWLPHLRFELGGDARLGYRLPRGGRCYDLPGRFWCRRRVKQAVSRAVVVFEEAIPKGHRGYLDAYLWRADDLSFHADGEAQLLELLPDSARRLACRSEATDPADEDADSEDKRAPLPRLTVPLDPREIDYRTLFQLIAHAELGLEPAVAGRIYLVDETDPLVFLMYTDEGAILHAPTTKRLRPLYERRGEWLVEGWRDTIDRQFGWPDGTSRPLQDAERAVLDLLLSRDFPGRDELLVQAQSVQTTGSSCTCGCPSFSLLAHRHLPRADAGYFPAAANGTDPVGNDVTVELHVRCGYLSEVIVGLCGEDVVHRAHDVAHYFLYGGHFDGRQDRFAGLPARDSLELLLTP